MRLVAPVTLVSNSSALQAKGGGSGSERTLWTSSDGSDVRRWDIPSRHDMHLRRPESASRSPYARSSPILSGGTGRSRGQRGILSCMRRFIEVHCWVYVAGCTLYVPSPSDTAVLTSPLPDRLPVSQGQPCCLHTLASGSWQCCAKDCCLQGHPDPAHIVTCNNLSLFRAAASSAATRSVAAAARPSQEIRGVAPLTQFRVLPDKRHVLVGDSEGRLSLWDVAIGQEVERYGAGMKFSEKYR